MAAGHGAAGRAAGSLVLARAHPSRAGAHRGRRRSTYPAPRRRSRPGSWPSSGSAPSARRRGGSPPGSRWSPLAALLRADTRGRVGPPGWSRRPDSVAAAVMGRDAVTAPLGVGEAYPWLGVPLVVAERGAHRRRRDRGGRAAVVRRVRVLRVAPTARRRRPWSSASPCPCSALGWWVGPASHGDLHRTVAVPVPAYMVDAMSSDDARVLVLRTGTPTVRYRVLAGDGERLGDDSVLPSGAHPATGGRRGRPPLAEPPGGCAGAGRAGDSVRRPAVPAEPGRGGPARRARRAEPHVDGAVGALGLAGGAARRTTGTGRRRTGTRATGWSSRWSCSGRWSPCSPRRECDDGRSQAEVDPR